MLDLPELIELDIHAKKQETMEWCWIGCICGIAESVKIASVPSEGELANLALGRTDCTHDPVPQDCIVPAPAIETVVVLSKLGITCVGPDAALAPEALLVELLAKQPIMAGLVWPGGGHYTIIRGFRKWTKKFLVSDPFFGDGELSYAEIASAYSKGQWMFSYGRFAKVENSSG